MTGPALFHPSAERSDRVAVLSGGAARTYGELEAQSRRQARHLLADADAADLDGARVGFLMEPGFDYVVTQWAIWRAGGIAVPLCPDHPAPEIEYVIDDADCAALIGAGGTGRRIEGPAQARGIPFHDAADSDAGFSASDPPDPRPLPPVGTNRPAMILYTSGTTGRPKGVVTTHGQIEAHIRSLLDAWRWGRDDRVLHVLPLHHTHGIVNALCCPLYAGATVEFAGPFNPAGVWERLASDDITVFMAVPTIYAKLLRAWDAADGSTRRRWSRGAGALRLMVSGSAALPVRVFERWEEITGHRLLERYGMTEIGMGLSNPYDGERRPGTVGQPLPGVGLRLVRPATGRVLAEGTEALEPGESGEIRIRGAMVFSEYWRRPEETAAAFVDGWFRTGDEAVLEDGYYRLLGRRSVDILKSGGYKISAVEIEELLRTHPAVRDCAVVGIPDDDWGERIAAAVVPEPGTASQSDSLPERLDPWVRERLARYKVPRAWLCVGDLPRNAMGKVRKPAVQALFDIPSAPS
ncbi:acyl-CoA synthetase [Candidatus Palauibacter soopunensis]|uniref:acyl-CoA synthetase n=1 Tax=Candidatus Palauibacter soopunensis TaxID=3056739 RepID=UPI002385EEB6|nr:acyl-CoA synthetase [Candidatus Palauibacter soopunensis]MDE2878176.1 acyl-CoA synthetase [Candidatus Palauibacter soopunensis]